MLIRFSDEKFKGGITHEKILLRAAALLLALVLAGCGTASPAETVPTEADKTDDNYRVFYEIFVGSFADSDGMERET